MLTALRNRFANRRTGLAIRFAVVAALVLAAFAHRAVNAEPVPAELAAYVLPDGTLPDICLTGDTNDTGHDHGTVACEFCLIAGGAALAAPVADASAVHRSIASADLNVAARTDLSPFPACATAPVRGPPSLSA